MYRRCRLKVLKKCRYTLFNNCKCNRNNSTRNEVSELGRAYDPKNIEEISEETSSYFSPSIKNELKPFSMILPPPNITGTLHLGHALTVTIQDVLMRWHRMRGYNTEWVPGIDHAGIATQVVVEKKLWKEKNISRHALGREKFQSEIWKWKNDKEKVIINQLRRLAPSMSLSVVPFTMNPSHSEAVTRAFITLHESGLVYRADRLVNWSCRLQSAISDIEVERRDVAPGGQLMVPGYEKPVMFGQLVKFGYKVVDGSEGEELVVATTRPETIPGDVAVAVHPDDTRYARFVGRRVWNPFRQTAIPVIADHFVDRSFGTGVVKITPAHDPTDFDVAHRHNLPLINIFSPSGQLTADAIDLRLINARRFDARALTLDALAQWNLLRGIEAHALSVPICTRSDDVVEYSVRPQWFVRCAEMAQRTVQEVREGRLRIEPKEKFESVWFGWLENIRDWCVSRQLWWGHRIPAYNCISTSGLSCWVAANNVGEAKLKGAEHLGVNAADVTCSQDEDVLDTWFSSAILPFSLNGWPKDCESMNTTYPLSLMETGHDILFFWVARMVMLGVQLTGKLPFDTVLLHGVICDAQGRKMSKSLGNVIAPEDVIYGSTLQELEDAVKANYESGILTKEELAKAIKNQKKMFPDGIPQCGADALRFTLCSHNIKSHFINFDIQECKINKFFGNKMWQATKFTIKWIATVADSIDGPKQPDSFTLDKLQSIDLWILSRLSYMVDTVNDSIGKHDFHTATNAFKNFMYYEFCDIYLEASKMGLDCHNHDDTYKHQPKVVAIGHCYTLTTCLDLGLRIVAPFMPTLAEHLHRTLVANDQWNWIKSVEYPENLGWRNELVEKNIADILEVITAIRRFTKMFNLKLEHQKATDPMLNFKIPCFTVTTPHPDLLDVLHNHLRTIAELVNCNCIPMTPDSFRRFADSIKEVIVSDTILGGRAQVHLSLTEEQQSSLKKSIDGRALYKQKVNLTKELTTLRCIMEAETYKEKVGEGVYQKNIKKVAKLEEKLARIELIQKYGLNS